MCSSSWSYGGEGEHVWMIHLIGDVMSENITSIKRRRCKCSHTAGTSLEECVLLSVASWYLGREGWIIWCTEPQNKPCEARSAWCSQCPLTSTADHVGGQNHWSSKEADCLVRNCIKNANLGIWVLALWNAYLQSTALQMENRMKITVTSHRTIFPRLFYWKEILCLDPLHITQRMMIASLAKKKKKIFCVRL